MKKNSVKSKKVQINGMMFIVDRMVKDIMEDHNRYMKNPKVLDSVFEAIDIIQRASTCSAALSQFMTFDTNPSQFCKIEVRSILSSLLVMTQIAHHTADEMFMREFKK